MDLRLGTLTDFNVDPGRGVTLRTLNSEGAQCEDLISFGAIAYWKEALGVETTLEAIQGCLHAANVKTEDHGGADREGEREALLDTRENIIQKKLAPIVEEAEAVQEGTRNDPRSPRLRAMVAEKAATDVLEDSQVQMHSLLGLSLPKVSVSSRSHRFALPAKQEGKWEELEGVLEGDLREVIHSKIRDFYSPRREINGT